MAAEAATAAVVVVVVQFLARVMVATIWGSVDSACGA